MASRTQQSARASQELLNIEEIRDSVAILKSGGLRAVLMASSINFGLKSQEEQDAVVAQYQNFLNGLDFTVQFFISSRDLDIRPYTDMLRERAGQETEELLKIQINEYIDFIQNFVEVERIVSKSFYIVVPFDPAAINVKSSGVGKLFGMFRKQENTVTPNDTFEERRSQLFQRADAVAQGLAGLGVRTALLNTEELVELYYRLYNPDEARQGLSPQTGQTQ